ncbi:MAG: hypothetical protein HQK72_12325 [Desulfamplus sp.]|nr:hypothetical protein [Desulfamplus sp.]
MNRTYFIIGLIVIAFITGCAENYNREFTEGYNDNYYATYTEMPPILFDEPPELIVVPKTYVYVVPDLDEELFFYSGWWWRPWKGKWYRSRHYTSGWIHYQNTPSFYRDIPPDWRNSYRDHRWRGREWDYHRIPHRNVERNWSEWERARHWENEGKRHHNKHYERIDSNQDRRKRNEKFIKERDNKDRYDRMTPNQDNNRHKEKFIKERDNNNSYERRYLEQEEHNNKEHQRINSDMDYNREHKHLDHEEKRHVNDTDSNVQNPEIPNHRRYIKTMENIEQKSESVEIQNRNRLKLEDRP